MSALEPTPVANPRIWALPLVAMSGQGQPTNDADHSGSLRIVRPAIISLHPGGTVDLHGNPENSLVFSLFRAAPVERTLYSNKALRTYSSKAAGAKLYVAFV